MKARPFVVRSYKVTRADFQRGIFYRPHKNNQNWRANKNMALWIQNGDNYEFGISDGNCVCFCDGILYQDIPTIPWDFKGACVVPVVGKLTIEARDFYWPAFPQMRLDAQTKKIFKLTQ